jgi:histidine ammonia-lyase
MITQYTAAALVSENKVLAHPASVDSVPTSAGLEDHVSMGCHAARKAREITANVRWVLATEIVCAAQALDFHHPLQPGHGVARAHALVREAVPHVSEDREFAVDIGRVAAMIASGRFSAAAA